MELLTMPLKFRIWDKEDKNFLITSRVQDGYELIHIEQDISDVATFIAKFGKDRLAISQDTGCKDDAGESLYTGDIVEDTMFNFRGPKIRMVITYNGHANVALCPDGLEDSLLVSSRFHKVGNIWQNLELLEGLDKNDNV